MTLPGADTGKDNQQEPLPGGTAPVLLSVSE